MNEVRRIQQKYLSVLSRVVTVGLMLKPIIAKRMKGYEQRESGYLGSIFLTAIL